MSINIKKIVIFVKENNDLAMIIDRICTENLKEYLVNGKVNLLFGARRTGKTSLLKNLANSLSIKYLFINGEDITTQNILSERSIANYKRLTSGIELLIIDEAQVIPNIGQILKLIVDEIPDLKILVSGSSAFDLSSQSGEPLVGRAFWHYLYPIAQVELNAHENYLETKENLSERLIYGSYPELFQLSTFKQKERYLNDIVNGYLFKDILSFDGIRSAAKIKDLVKLVAFQIGNEVSLNELGKQLGMSKNTVEKYLDLLEKTFVLKKVNGFSRNLRKEIAKSSRWYFWDNGVRNAVLGDFRAINDRQDKGELWENYLLTERLKMQSYTHQVKDYYFWRTYDQQEIDWIEEANGAIEAFEFKWQTNKVKAPEAFSKAYPDAKFEVITKENYFEFVGMPQV